MEQSKTFKKVLCPKCGKHLMGQDGKGVLVYCRRCKTEHYIPLTELGKKERREKKKFEFKS